jgi:hypothetical protein
MKNLYKTFSYYFDTAIPIRKVNTNKERINGSHLEFANPVKN